MPAPESGSRPITTPGTESVPVQHAGTSRFQSMFHEHDTVDGRPLQNPPPPGPAPAPQPDMRPARAAKTSSAATFALVFGLAALFCALTAILSPAAILFGIIGLILAAVGIKMAKKPGVTGRGVAIGGLVTALLGLILGGVVLGGIASVLNNRTQLDRIQSYLDKQQAKLPSVGDVRNTVDNTTGQ